MKRLLALPFIAACCPSENPLIRVPGGTYLLAAGDESNPRQPKTVTLPSFRMQQYESAARDKRDRLFSSTTYLPEDAEAVCKRQKMRLPTEEEWEVAAGFPTPHQTPTEFSDGIFGMRAISCKYDLCEGAISTRIKGSYRSPLGFGDLTEGSTEWVVTTDGSLVLKGVGYFSSGTLLSSRQSGLKVGAVRCVKVD